MNGATPPAPHAPRACRTPYQKLLGAAYDRLHPHVRVAHEAPLTAVGVMDVVHGTHPLTSFFVRAMHLPAAGASRPVTLEVTLASSASSPCRMTWMRYIGTTRLDTNQFARLDYLVERSGPGAVQFSLHEDEGALVYEGAGCHFLSIPVPRALAPAVHARVAPTSDGWHVAVTVHWQGQLICTYRGSMRPIQPAIVA